MARIDDYKMRHKGVINKDFCLNNCLQVDGIIVPFPDCKRHGNPYTNDLECAIIKVRP